MSTGREVATLNLPTNSVVDDLVPEPPAIKFPVDKVTEGDVNRAAESAGLVKLDARSIRSCRVLGAYVEQEGALAVGQGILWLTAHNLTKAINRCGELLERPPIIDKDAGETPHQVMNDLMKAMTELSGNMIKTATGIGAMAKLSKEVREQAPPPVSPFGKGQVVMPIQAGHVTINNPTQAQQ